MIMLSIFATWNFGIRFTFELDNDGCSLPVKLYGSCVLGDPLESVDVRGTDRVVFDWLMVRTSSDADVGVGIVRDVMLGNLDPGIVWVSYRGFGLLKNCHVYSQCNLCGV